MLPSVILYVFVCTHKLALLSLAVILCHNIDALNVGEVLCRFTSPCALHSAGCLALICAFHVMETPDVCCVSIR